MTEAQLSAATAAVTAYLNAYIEANVPGLFQSMAKEKLAELAAPVTKVALAAAEATPA